MATLDSIVEKCDSTDNKAEIRQISRNNKAQTESMVAQLHAKMDKFQNADYEWGHAFDKNFNSTESVGIVKQDIFQFYERLASTIGWRKIKQGTKADSVIFWKDKSPIYSKQTLKAFPNLVNLKDQVLKK